MRRILTKPTVQRIVMKFVIIIAAIALTLLLFRSISYAADVPRTGDAAPDFRLPDAKQQIHTLKDYSGKWLVLYFYPKNDTPGCTQEACAFRDDLFQIEKLNAKVVGVSVDDTDSHAEFAKNVVTMLEREDGLVGIGHSEIEVPGIELFIELGVIA